ncbi:MAG: AAA family ATPase, partial [Chloroflexota bacterium]
TQKTYQEMLHRARKLLAQGRWVILDATFGKREQREKSRELAQSAGAEFLTIETTVPEGLIRDRLEQRLRAGTVSDARWETYVAEKADFEPVGEVHPSQYIRLDTSAPLEKLAAKVVSKLEGIS